MKPNQQAQLPTMPRDFSQPVECRGHDLAAVIAEAQAAGYHAHRMTAADVAVYRLQFFRLAGTAEAGCPPEKFRKPVKSLFDGKGLSHSCQSLCAKFSRKNTSKSTLKTPKTR